MATNQADGPLTDRVSASCNGSVISLHVGFRTTTHLWASLTVWVDLLRVPKFHHLSESELNLREISEKLNNFRHLKFRYLTTEKFK